MPRLLRPAGVGCLSLLSAACVAPAADTALRPARVAILDEGFGGHEALLGGALPAAVEAHLLPGSEAVSHGTAVAEVVHSLAPEASLVFVAFRDRDDFADVVTSLEDLDLDIVVASVGFDNVGPLDGTNSWTTAVDALIARTGVLWFNAAGNSADATRVGALAEEEGRVTFGGELSTRVRAPGGELRVRLRATDGGTLAGLALHAWEEDGALCASQAADSDILEVEATCASTTVRLTLEGVVASTDAVLWTRDGFYGGGAPAPSSLAVPADTREGLTVGVCDPAEDTVPAFSGRGPTEDGRTKPDLCAADGLTTETAGLSAFTGTSAANAWVAGLAARLWDGDAEGVRAALRARAVDLRDPGPDDATGWGAPMD